MGKKSLQECKEAQAHRKYKQVLDSLTQNEKIASFNVELLYNLVAVPIFHPIYILLHIRNSDILMERVMGLSEGLEVILEQHIDGIGIEDPVIAFKCHYISYILKVLHFEVLEVSDGDEQPECQQQDIDRMIKKYMGGRIGDGFPIKVDNLIKRAAVGFPRKDLQIYQALMQSLAATGLAEEPNALSVLQLIIEPSGDFEWAKSCRTCGEMDADKSCGICRKVQYCSKDCQRIHWPDHKKFCKGEQGDSVDENKDAPNDQPSDDKGPEVLSEGEKALFKAVKAFDFKLVMKLVQKQKVNANGINEDGLSPLAVAIMSENLSAALILANRARADPNFVCKRYHNYSLLMLAAELDSVPLVTLLLHAGASVTKKNGRGQTAADIARMQGAVYVLELIQGYKANKVIQRRATACVLVYDFSYGVWNIHPIRVILELINNRALFEHIPQVLPLLQDLTEKEVNKKRSEVMGLKYHFLGFMFDLVGGYCASHPSKMSRTKILENLIKQWLEEPSTINDIVCEGILCFPYKRSKIWLELLRAISNSSEDQGIDLLSLLQQAIDDVPQEPNPIVCNTCGSEESDFVCPRCEQANYCDNYCYNLHRFIHEKNCDQA